MPIKALDAAAANKPLPTSRCQQMDLVDMKKDWKRVSAFES